MARPRRICARLFSALIGCLLLPQGRAVRHNHAEVPGSRSWTDNRGTKLIKGVPVYNYHLAFQTARFSSFLESIKNETTVGVEHWLAYLKDEVPDSRIAELCKANVKCTHHGHTTGVAFLEFTGTEKELEQMIATAWKEIAFIEPDMPTGLVPEIPPDGDQVRIKTAFSWGLDRIRARQRPTTGRGVHIYILDSGVRASHSDFEGRVVPTLQFTSGYTQECGGNPLCAVDRNGHGTHCAGIAAGRNYGVAPGATIHAVKVLGDDGRGAASWNLRALDWIARNAPRPAVASMSLGRAGNSYGDREAIDRTVKAGVTVVVAAGNEADNACRYQPAFVPSAFTVGATNTYNTVASYSNYGTCVDIFAPGSDITSTGHTSDSDRKTMSGTSMACPHVAGAVALILESNPSWSPTQVQARLAEMAEKNAVRGSLLGAPNLLLSVGGAPPSMSSPTPTPSLAPSPSPSDEYRQHPRLPGSGNARSTPSASLGPSVCYPLLALAALWSQAA